MNLKIAQLFVLDGMPDYERLLRRAGLEVELIKEISLTEEAIIMNATDADAIICVGTFQPFTKKVMENLQKCRLIASVGIGYDKIDVKAASERCILVANVPDYCWEEMSDHIMALILSCTRRIVQLYNEVKKGKWKMVVDPDIQKDIWPAMTRLKGRVLGLIGFGGVSRALVPKAKGFGLKVIAYDPYVSSDIFGEFAVQEVTDLDELLLEADVIATNANLTQETRHLIGMDQLKRMKPTACIVNVARGPLIDHKALYIALKEGYISMAALDVTEPEPIPPDDPLLKLDNFIATAHSAHFSPSAWEELLNRPGKEIIRLFKNRELPKGLLNPEIKDEYEKKWGGLK
ncbi:MAG: C-terminal binding protein [Pseudomonadota bacterium]